MEEKEYRQGDNINTEEDNKLLEDAIGQADYVRKVYVVDNDNVTVQDDKAKSE